MRQRRKTGAEIVERERDPWFLRLVTIVRARSMSANSELSVTSTTSRSAGKPVSDSKRTIFCASQLSVNWRGEMLIER